MFSPTPSPIAPPLCDEPPLETVYPKLAHRFLPAARNGADPSLVPCVLQAVGSVYLPKLIAIRETLYTKAIEWDQFPMLARTHGQPATPTRLGKEFRVFVERLDVQIAELRRCHEQISAKFGGATGSFNAHHVAFPAVDWRAFANSFIVSAS